MSKRIITIILVSLISLTCAFGSFASEIATSSNAQLNIATSSNAMPSDDFLESDGFDTLDVPSLFAASGLPSVTNTVDYSAVSVGVEYYDMSNVRHTVWRDVGSDGWFNFQRPSDFVRLYAVRVYLGSGALPPSGKYKFEIVCNTQGGGANNPNWSTMGFSKKYTNTAVMETFPEVSIISNYSEFYATGKVDLGAVSSVCLYVSYPDSESRTFGFNFNGAVKIRFERLSSSASTDISSPGADSSAQDIQQDIADNSAQQVEQGDTIIELIKNTIQTISSQLTAFWNQLAGEFTNLYNKMTQQHSEQLQADRDNTDDIIAAEESNTTDIINNDNRNTDTVVNGYDSSNLDESGNKLNDKLQEYESAESNIHDTASGWLSDYTMPDFDNFLNTGGILSACIWLGGFWQTVFVNMGAFNIPVTLSLTLVFVLMLVGYHRFRR